MYQGSCLPLGLPFACWFISKILSGIHADPGTALAAAGPVRNKTGVSLLWQSGFQPQGRAELLLAGGRVVG